MWEGACCEVTGQRVGTQARTQLKAGRPTTTDIGRHVRHRLVCNAVLLSLSLQQPSRTSAGVWPCVPECMLLSGWSPSTEVAWRGTSVGCNSLSRRGNVTALLFTRGKDSCDHTARPAARGHAYVCSGSQLPAVADRGSVTLAWLCPEMPRAHACQRELCLRDDMRCA